MVNAFGCNKFYMKIKFKKMKSLLLFLLILQISATAQSVKIASIRVSPIIGSVLHNLSYTIKLPDKKIALLAQYLKNQDNILEQEIKNGVPMLKDLDLFSFETLKFNEIIRANPSETFYQTDQLNISIISCALIFRNRLKIDNVQIEKLLKLNQNKIDDKAEIVQLSEILNSSQTAKLFELISAKEASDWALRDWNKFKDFKIADGLDSIEVYNNIYDYRRKRLAFHNFYTRIDQKDSVAKGGFRHSTTDLPRVFLKVLKADKYRVYFEKSNIVDVDATAKKNWDDIKLLGLANDIDSVKAKSDLRHYEMNVRFANDRVFIENSLKSVFERQDLVNDKPKILKDLERARSNSINNRF